MYSFRHLLNIDARNYDNHIQDKLPFKVKSLFHKFKIKVKETLIDGKETNKEGN